MTNTQRKEYESWNKTKLITEINRLMKENTGAYEKGYADGSLSVTEEILAHKDKKIRAKGMLKGEKGCQQ